MAGKKNAKKPNAKKLQRIWKLKAIEPVYKAACMKYGVPPYKPLLEQIEQHVTDMKVFNKICLQGTHITEKFVRILMECMAGYPDITNISFWGCAVGDELNCLTVDVRKERYQLMVEGKTGFVAPNPGLQMPSWVVGTAPAMSHPIPPIYKQTHRQESGLQPSDDPVTPATTFSPKALRAFSLAIGIAESPLAVLVLDHNHLGDTGAEILSAGLQRAVALKSISLAHCGIGAQGVLALASTMGWPGDPVTNNKKRPHPNYEIVNLQGNNFGGQGLMNFCEGLKHSTSLKSINLSSIGVTEDDTQAVKAFASSLALSQTVVEVDFSANHIENTSMNWLKSGMFALGNQGCEHFIPLLNVAKHIKILRLTHRIDRSVAKQIYEAVRLNSGKKAVGKKGTHSTS